MKIPKIIHQVYEDPNGPPDSLKILSESWIEKNPDWQYVFWSKKEMENLVKEFPDFMETYYSFPFSIQRWDAIRYLILYKHGGLYVDMDYECLEPIDDLFEKGDCFWGVEPVSHAKDFGIDEMIGNAFMASIPRHHFLVNIIDDIKTFEYKGHKVNEVMYTTGPLMITRLYSKVQNKSDISLISAKLVTPLTKQEVRMVILKEINEDIKEKIDNAYAIHYFFGSWLTQLPQVFRPFVDYIKY